MFKKSLIAVSAVFLAILMVPTIKASAENAVSGSAIVTESLATTGSSITLKKARKVRKSGYRPVNAKKLSASYKKKLRKQKKNWIGVSYGNYKSRVKAEQKSLIDISWEELKANSQVKITKKAFDLMCRPGIQGSDSQASVFRSKDVQNPYKRYQRRNCKCMQGCPA